MEIFPPELVYYIFDLADLPVKIALTQLNNYYHDNLQIIDFYDIDEKYRIMLTDDILQKYPYIKKLNAYNNLKITDEGLKYLNLEMLNVSMKFSSYETVRQITKDGLKHMNLKYFEAKNAGYPLFTFWNELRKKQLETMITTNSFISKEQINHQGKIYDIHDNGGRPYKVVAKDQEITVFKQTLINESAWKDDERYSKEYTEKVLHIHDFFGYWFGYDSSIRECHGNTILIKVSKNKYITVQQNMYSFETDDEIIEYVSPIGNNDVPYPVAFGSTNIYFMLDKQFVPIKEFNQRVNIKNTEELYVDFYEYNGNKTSWKNIVTLYFNDD